MNRNDLRLSVIAGVTVALLALIPYFGAFLLAPLAVLLFAAAAGRQASNSAGSHPTSAAARTSLGIGLGALIGSILGVMVLVLVVVNIPAVQEYIRLSEPNPEARLPYSWMVPLGGVAGATVGFVAGLIDLLLALVGGVLAGWVADLNRHVPA